MSHVRPLNCEKMGRLRLMCPTLICASRDAHTHGLPIQAAAVGVNYQDGFLDRLVPDRHAKLCVWVSACESKNPESISMSGYRRNARKSNRASKLIMTGRDLDFASILRCCLDGYLSSLRSATLESRLQETSHIVDWVQAVDVLAENTYLQKSSRTHLDRMVSEELHSSIQSCWGTAVDPPAVEITRAPGKFLRFQS
jgi:hypothetical protein